MCHGLAGLAVVLACASPLHLGYELALVGCRDYHGAAAAG